MKSFAHLFCENIKKDLKKSMRGSDFIFDSVDLLYYHLQKTSLSRKVSSYIDSPKWLKNKKQQKIQEIMTTVPFNII